MEPWSLAPRSCPFCGEGRIYLEDLKAYQQWIAREGLPEGCELVELPCPQEPAILDPWVRRLDPEQLLEVAYCERCDRYELIPTSA